MHSYLRAIGFSKLEQKDLDQILQEVIVSCDEKKIAEQGKNEIFAELSRYFGMNIGLRVCGTYDEQDQFRMEYYFPYFAGSGITTYSAALYQSSASACHPEPRCGLRPHGRPTRRCAGNPVQFRFGRCQRGRLHRGRCCDRALPLSLIHI